MIPTTLLVRALLISRGHACWRHDMQTFPRYWSFMGGIQRSLVDCPKRPIMQSFDVFVAHGHNSPKWYPNVLALVYRVYPISHCTGPRYNVNRLYSLYTASISSFLISWYLATPRHQYTPYWILGIIQWNPAGRARDVSLKLRNVAHFRAPFFTNHVFITPHDRPPLLKGHLLGWPL